jgi:hypothetical protein
MNEYHRRQTGNTGHHLLWQEEHLNVTIWMESSSGLCPSSVQGSPSQTSGGRHGGYGSVLTGPEEWALWSEFPLQGIVGNATVTQRSSRCFCTAICRTPGCFHGQTNEDTKSRFCKKTAGISPFFSLEPPGSQDWWVNILRGEFPESRSLGLLL